MKAARPGTLRRAPVQQRSEQRVAALVRAAAELFDELGYAQTTTAAIAQRAGVPIGTLYQFFRDKPQLLHAVAEGLRDHIQRSTRALVASSQLAQAALPDVIDRLVDLLIDEVATQPGFREVSAMLGRDELLAAGHRTHHALLVDVVASALATRNQALDAAERRVIAHTAVWLTNVAYAPTNGGDQRSRALQRREAKRVLVRYLQPYVDGAS